MTFINRRHMLGTLAVAGMNFPNILRADAPKARINETQVISLRPDHYHGWSTLARRKDGELLLVCSGGRENHVCPFGQVELMRSKDEGATWSFPRVLLDSPIDDRDAGILETSIPRGSPGTKSPGLSTTRYLST